MGKKYFAIAEVLTGELNALVKNIMRQTGVTDANEAVRLVNSGEWTVSRLMRKWREEAGIIYFSVTSNGRTGEEWIAHFEANDVTIGEHAKHLLRSEDFKPTNGITYDIGVLKGTLFSDVERITSNIIRAFAAGRSLTTPTLETACLIRDMFTNREIMEMGLWFIFTMHEPIENEVGDPCLLDAGDGDDDLDTSVGALYDSDDGYAFVAPSAPSSQS